ncbi:MAG: hypothetical protein ACKO8I_19410, partial [Cyanobacteriota bacterium]
RKLRGPASKVGSKVKVIAQKIMARVKKALKKVGGVIKKGAKWVKGKAKGLKKKFDGMKAKRKAKKDAKKKGKEDPSKKNQDKKKAKQQRLDKAVEAIKPSVGQMLKKGVSKLVLKAKLLYWGVRYRLSALTLDGGSIVAKVNPSAVVDTTNPAQIGSALLPILQQVEARYRREVEAGDVDDPEFKEIQAIRAYREGKGPKPEGYTIFDEKNSARYLSPIDKSYLGMEKKGKLPSRRLGMLERARGLGNVVGMDVADAMGSAGILKKNELRQNKNIMCAKGTAKAADMGFVIRGYGGALTRSERPEAARRAEKTVKTGRAAIAKAIGEVFLALKAAVEKPDSNLLATPGAPLTKLAHAFKSWLEANLPRASGKIDERRLKRAKAELRGKLLVFIRAYRGGS